MIFEKTVICPNDVIRNDVTSAKITRFSKIRDFTREGQYARGTRVTRAGQYTRVIPRGSLSGTLRGIHAFRGVGT